MPNPPKPTKAKATSVTQKKRSATTKQQQMRRLGALKSKTTSVTPKSRSKPIRRRRVVNQPVEPTFPSFEIPGDTESKKGVATRAKDLIHKNWEKAKKEIEDLGGWEGIKSGDWFMKLVGASFKAYYQKAN